MTQRVHSVAVCLLKFLIAFEFELICKFATGPKVNLQNTKNQAAFIPLYTI